MFYEPSSGVEYASIYDFRLAHRNTSFGDFDTEAALNSVGLFTLNTERPEYNPVTHTVEPSGVELRDGVWSRAWQVTPLPAAELRVRLAAAVTERRWAVETGGITLPGGMVVGTTLDDQNRITSVIANAQVAGVASVDFKAASGWVTLTVAEVQAIAAAIARHVQACFSAERAHHEALAATADEALLAYDIEAGWPAGAA